MLEETGLKHRIHAVNIRKGEQFRPAFLKINPNHRIPAIVDCDGPNGEPLALFESGAILIYLASKSARLLPVDTETLDVRAVGDVADERHRSDDGAGEPLSPLCERENLLRGRALHERSEPADERDYPNVKRWFDAISARPAVQRGVRVLAEEHSSAPHDPKAWDIMFGKIQFQHR